jgi:hypothetical protein
VIRDLKIVETDKKIGSVSIDGSGRAKFIDAADKIFAAARWRAGSGEKAAADLLRHGWSNGYLYLGPTR